MKSNMKLHDIFSKYTNLLPLLSYFFFSIFNAFSWNYRWSSYDKFCKIMCKIGSRWPCQKLFSKKVLENSQESISFSTLTLSRRRPLSYRNQSTGFYMTTASVLKGLITLSWSFLTFFKQNILDQVILNSIEVH